MSQEQIAHTTKRGSNAWIKAFLGGLVLFFVSLAILDLTRNPNLFPTVVLVGNALVPVTYVAFFYERRHLSRLSLPTTASTFLYGGLLGVLAAALLEPFFVRPADPISVLWIGVIEEGAKILGVILIVRRRESLSEMDGLILGAAAGMGFAALESMGYTFTEFLRSGGSLSASVAIMLIRGILSPFGHGTWTAILASVLFRERKGNRLRLNGRVIVAFFGVVLLHALWDVLPPIVAYIFSSGLDIFIAQMGIGLIGFFILWLRWRTAKRAQLEQLSNLEMAAAVRV
jgi:RsiW-degrading membrane proteinase PrsW (M82 family)